MTVSTKPMPNMASTVRALVIAVVALALSLAGVPRAAAVPDPADGALDSGPNFATFEISNGDFPVVPGAVEQLGLWWKCEGSAHWSGPGSNDPPDVFAPVLYLNGYCERGFAMGDETLKVKAESPGCGDWVGTFGNVDQSNMRPFNNVELSNSWEDYNEGVGCGQVIEICFQDESFFTGDYAEGDWRCVTLGLIPPPPMEGDPDPAEAGECPRATLLRPYVSVAYTFGNTGSWRWRYDVYFRVDGKTPYVAGSGLKIGGTSARLKGYVKGSQNFSIVSSTPAQRTNTAGVGTAHAVSFDHDASLAATPAVTEIKLTIQSDLNSGAVGSVSAPPVYSAGYYTDSSDGVQASVSMGNNAESMLTDVQWQSVSSAAGWAGHTYLDWCYAAWGDLTQDASGYGLPSGPLGTVSGPTETPPPYVPGPTYTPPTVEVNDDCSASTADVCVEPPEPPPGQMPDPDSEECDLSAWDPTTYPQQVECGLARIVQVVVVTQVSILNVLQEILDTITNLLLPPEDLWADLWGRFEAEWEDSTLDDWSTTLAGLLPDSDVSENCQGPAVGPVELLHDGPGGSDVEVPAMHPFDACGDKEPIAHSVRAVIAAGVTLGGAWRIWDMITGSLGAYRGGGRHMSEKEWI